ncbi:MAG: hypothetical protein IJ860_03785 [Eubacterium sp.]|nr:hypothetical protein [Eubacterium sp.]
MKWIKKLERRFGRYAIPNLTRYIILTYVIGYVLYLIQTSAKIPLIGYLTMDPGLILRGQVWRVISWVLMPPSDLSIWTIIMLYLYYQLGSELEDSWGTFLYNFYIFFGVIMTVIGAFIAYALVPGARLMFSMATAGSIPLISTYYISLSIFLGFAMTFPNQRLLFMFIFPIKIKYLAIVDIVYLVYNIVASRFYPAVVIMIVCSLASTIVFFFGTRDYSRINPKERKRQRDFRQAMNGGAGGSGFAGFGSRSSRTEGQSGARAAGGSAQTRIARHRCAVCGRTELDDPTLEFRFCSRCNGNYEYCNDHLFSHKHVE